MQRLTIETDLYGALIEEPLPAPEPDGYRFDGWYKADMTVELNFAEDTVTTAVSLRLLLTFKYFSLFVFYFIYKKIAAYQSAIL